MMVQQTDLTIRKTLHVDAPIERAFEVFTDRVAEWWPFDTHSIEGKTRPELQLEWREGGVNGELVDGELQAWYDVLAYEPPSRVLLRWRVNPEKPATQVEVVFAEDGAGTRVELTHSGWETYGEEEGGGFDGYNKGWDAVLGHYVDFFSKS